MSEEKQRTARKAVSMRTAANSSRVQRPAENSKAETETVSASDTGREKTRTSSGKSRTEPQTIFLNTRTVDERKSAKSPSLLSRLKQKYDDAVGSSDAGSSYKRQLAKKTMRNDLIKKGIILLAALIIVILLVVLIVNSVQVKDVSNLSIDSTATTQTLNFRGAKKGRTYEVYRAEGTSGEYTLVSTMSNGENSLSFDNLTAGTLYKYNIVAVKGNGSKTNGAKIEAYTKPNTVTGATAITTAEKSLTAVWNLQGSTESYELKYGLYDNMRDATTITFPADEAQAGSIPGSYNYTISDLVLNETYYMSIRTICEDNASEWSSVFSGTVSETITPLNLDDSKPMVALTFDGGPDAGTVTARILDVLSEYNGHATFFQTGENAELYPQTMRRIVNEGHEVGNHTYDESHVGGDITADDILNANNAIQVACGVYPKLFRAPEGNVTDAILDTCSNAGMSIILWNFDSHDWEYYDPNDIVIRIESYVDDGDIIQFRNIYDETATAIETLVPYLVDQGYQLVTVSQLIQAKTGGAPVPGTIYRTAVDTE